MWLQQPHECFDILIAAVILYLCSEPAALVSQLCIVPTYTVGKNLGRYIILLDDSLQTQLPLMDTLNYFSRLITNCQPVVTKTWVLTTIIWLTLRLELSTLEVLKWKIKHRSKDEGQSVRDCYALCDHMGSHTMGIRVQKRVGVLIIKAWITAHYMYRYSTHMIVHVNTSNTSQWDGQTTTLSHIYVSCMYKQGNLDYRLQYSFVLHTLNTWTQCTVP